jgi:predicted nucleotidyltransferase
VQRQDEIAAITKVIMETVDCEKIYLFGSYAYGEPNEASDFDFYVVLSDDSGRPLEARQRIYHAIRKANRTMPIDVLAARAGRFAYLSTLPSMERQIVREGVMLYERGGSSRQMV